MKDAKIDLPIKTLEDKWKLVPEFLKIRGLVKQHIESFDYFLNVEIKSIIRAHANQYVRSEQDSTFYLKYLDIKIGKPTYVEDGIISNIFPHTCRLRNITYSADIMVDIEYTLGNQIVRKNGERIGKMPIMLGCSNCWLRDASLKELAQMKECPYDPRGYFIIKGVEKVILIQEQMSKNRIIVEIDAKKNLCASVISSTQETKVRTTITLVHGKFYMKHNSFENEIPIFIIFKAMGIQSEQEIAQLVGSESKYLEAISLSIQECLMDNIFTQKQALKYLSGKMKSFKNSQRKGTLFEDIKAMINKVILSHIPATMQNPTAKCRYLALMIRRIIDAMNDPTKIDDKDYYGNKRLELAGQMLSLLFEDLFKKFNSDLKRQADFNIPKFQRKKEAFDILTAFRLDTITMGLEKAISSGQWSMKRFKMERKGVTQPLSRMSYLYSMGMMCRISSQVEKTRKISGPRALQPSQWGMLCPSDTPEGSSCGLVKTLALTSHVTTDQPEAPIINLAFNLGMEDVDLINGEDFHSPHIHTIFFNGRPLGVHRNPELFVHSFRILRRRGYINECVSIYQNESQQSVYISTDGGRLIRPVIVVSEGKPLVGEKEIKQLLSGLINFTDIVRKGLVEYLDVNEENEALIALSEKYIKRETTHLEIAPFTILSCVAGIIPYPHHNQSPRNTYQCAMGKQAIGTIGYNQLIRVDTLLYLLLYPQKPLVTTKAISLIHYDDLPAGHNASVAIMSYSGYDIEDAIIVNKASLDRGFGRTIVNKHDQIPLKKYENGEQEICVPSPIYDNKSKSIPAGLKKFKCLESDGLARVGALLESGDIYVNKQTPLITRFKAGALQKDEAQSYKPSPCAYKTPEPSYVDRVLLTSSQEDTHLVKIIFRQTRRPEVGDKFSSRHGQKGVIGLIVPQEDMPFSETGWIPDLIMNPHGFPSRMTVGKMIELISGKAGVMEGKFKDGTAFAGDKLNEMGKILIKHGYSYSGKDYLTSGITGQGIESYIFCGPIYYQRLKHMVVDKMHGRSRGPRALLTRQPTEGRAKEGGLRLGEMERDCLIGYGAASLLNERLMLSSDAFNVSVCNSCGLIGYGKSCSFCKFGAQMSTITIPYACKLLFQELEAMNIKPSLRLTDV